MVHHRNVREDAECRYDRDGSDPGSILHRYVPEFVPVDARGPQSPPHLLFDPAKEHDDDRLRSSSNAGYV